MPQITPISIPSKKLSQSILSTDASLKLNNIEGWSGTDLTSADLGTQHFCVLKNDNSTLIEIIEIDPSTIADASITILNRGLEYDGQQTEVTANKLNWAANETTVMLGTDVPQMLRQFANLSDAQTVAGVKTFSSFPVTPSSAPTTDYQTANKKYADDLAIAGSPDMSLTVKGIAEEATAAEINAGTQTGGTGAETAVNPKYLKDSEYYTQRPTAGEKAASVGNNIDIAVGAGNKFVTQTGLQDGAEVYAADAEASDTYVITLSPVPTALATGMVIRFKANTVNTGACTLNVNSLGAKDIKKNYDSALEDGDIKAGEIITVIYDGANFQTQSSVPSTDIETFSTDGTWTKPAGAKKVLVKTWAAGGSGGSATGADAGGGGGGLYQEQWFAASDLSATVAIGIGVGGVAKTDINAGAAGTATTFGAYVTGGGGGGGSTGTGANGGAGGSKFGNVKYIYGAGGTTAVGEPGTHSAGGGGATNTSIGHVGGNSYYGGAGGGGEENGSGPIAGGTSTYGGDGGASRTNGNAVAGSVPGGGGGANSGTGNSGAGGNGQAIITTFF